MFFKKFLYYINPINLFKKDKEAGINLRMMHGINKISFFAFFGVFGRDAVPLVHAVLSRRRAGRETGQKSSLPSAPRASSFRSRKRADFTFKRSEKLWRTPKGIQLKESSQQCKSTYRFKLVGVNSPRATSYPVVTSTL